MNLIIQFLFTILYSPVVLAKPIDNDLQKLVNVVKFPRSLKERPVLRGPLTKKETKKPICDPIKSPGCGKATDTPICGLKDGPGGLRSGRKCRTKEKELSIELEIETTTTTTTTERPLVFVLDTETPPPTTRPTIELLLVTETIPTTKKKCKKEPPTIMLELEIETTRSTKGLYAAGAPSTTPSTTTVANMVRLNWYVPNQMLRKTLAP